MTTLSLTAPVLLAALGCPAGTLAPRCEAVVAQLVEGGGLRPGVAVLGSANLPVGSAAYGSDAVQPQAALSLEWSLSDRAGLTSTVGYASVVEGAQRSGEASVALSLGDSLSDRVQAQLEWSRSGPAGQWAGGSPGVGGALSYLLTNDLQVDVWTGAEWAGGDTPRLWGVGVARRW